ncbi:MAG TPA: LCP family protein [Acidimicrobiales bacterium]|nr:LCP family protein [Acidimicrobiales bacterium]
MTSWQTPAEAAPTDAPSGNGGNGVDGSRPTEVDAGDDAFTPPRRTSKRARAAARRRAARGSSSSTAAPAPVAGDTTSPVRDGVVGEFVGLVAAGGIGAAAGLVEAPAPPVAPQPEPLGERPRRGPRARKIRRRQRLVVVAMVLLVGLGAGLVVVGLDRVRGSTAGTYVDATLRPDEPGYVALVTPTPTMLVLQRDASDELVGVALLGLRSQDEGGSVVLIPVATQAPFAEEGDDLRSVYTDGGADTVATQLELMLNLSIGDTVELDDTGWASLVDPVGSISMVLPAPVGDWPAGQVDLAAADVGSFLAARNDDESELARLDRQELFWDEWLPRVRAQGDDAVPGESDVGLGRFVRGLAAGTSEVVALPVASAACFCELFEPSEDLAPELVAQAVPYPQEPSVGARVRIRLLNGTSVPGLAVQAAAPLVEAGAEIALSGNASSFAEPRTRFIYGKSRLRQDTNSLRDALGVGAVEQASSDEESVEPADEADRIDVTVVLGADAPEVIRRLESTG